MVAWLRAGVVEWLSPAWEKRMPMLDEIKIRFTYHPPKLEQIKIYDETRKYAAILATHLDGALPDCREKSLAITKLEEVVMWANAAVARRT